jgi:thioester reductase-like protein
MATIYQDKAEIPSVPETFLYDYEAAADMGYGKSKKISERILDNANKQSGVPVSILRVGQIAGSTTLSDPAWPSQEWLPSMIKTSKSLKRLPANLPVIDWIPVDKLATIIIETIHSDTTLWPTTLAMLTSTTLSTLIQ